MFSTAWRAGLCAALLASSGRSQIAPSPALSLQRLNDQQLRLAWPTNSPGFVLEEAGTIGDPLAWQRVAGGVAQQGVEFALIVDLAPTNRFFRLRLAGGAPLTSIQDTSPAEGDLEIAVTRETIVYFSAPLAAGTLLTTNHFSAEAAGRRILSRVELSSDRRKATLFYQENLPAGTRVKATFHGDGLLDVNGQALDADGDGRAGGALQLSFDTLSTTPVSRTAVLGRVYASELLPGPTNANQTLNQPLEGVTITVDGAEETLRTTTDANGFFKLQPVPSGRFFVHVDGRTAKGSRWPTNDYYPFVGKAWEAVAGVETNLAGGTGEVFLPLIRGGSLQPVSATQSTVIGFPSQVIASNPALSGVSVTVPPNALFGDSGVRGGRVGIAPVSPNRLPEPLPTGLNLPLVITIQTDGPQNFDQPVPVRFPNLPDPVTGQKLPPGSKSALWSFNHDTGQWEIAGPMTVTADGNYVETDPGVGVLQPGWHGTQPGVSSGGGPLFGPCPDGSAPTGCHPRPGWNPEEHYNGCGPDGLDYLVPDNPNLPYLCATFYDACKAHDIGYGTCGRPKSATDERFLQEMLAACNCVALPSDRANCIAKAYAYYLAVSLGGEGAYEDAQQAACECDVPPPGCGGGSSALLMGWGQLPPSPTPADATWRRGRLSPMGPVKPNGTRPPPGGAVPQTGAHRYAVIDEETRQVVQRGRAGANGVAFSRLILAPNRAYALALLQEKTLYEGYLRVITGPSGSRLEIPPIFLRKPTSFDMDLDRLHDFSELIRGSDFENPDTDGDGILDGVEVQQGTDPLGGSQVDTGVIGSAPTRGFAVDVATYNNLAAVAERDQGVGIFDIASGMNPVLLQRVDTPGSAGAVAFGDGFLAVADGPAGLAVIDLRDPARATPRPPVILGSTRSVAVAGFTAYAGLDNGDLVAVDVMTGAVLQRLRLPNNQAVHDLVVSGETLFALTVGRLYALPLDEGDLQVSSAVDSPGSVGAGLRRLRLFVAEGLAYASHTTGFNVLDVSDRTRLRSLRVNDTAQRGWKQIVPNGSGLGVAAVDANSTDDGPHDIALYTLGPDGLGNTFLTTLSTPGLASAVALNDGLAYVADGLGGLQVINYLAFDRLRTAPQIQLAASFPLAPPTAEEGKLVRVTARVTDDVQVRNVEFYVDGRLVAVDGSYPFEHRFITPLRASAPGFTLLARATDTGGNTAQTEQILVTLVADATPPRVVSRVPGNGAIAGEVRFVSAGFSEPIARGTLTVSSFELRTAGADNAWGTTDDARIDSGLLEYLPELSLARLNFGVKLPPGLYQVAVQPPIADLAGNPLASTVAWNFWVTGQTDADGDGVPDNIETALGFDPNKPDTDGDGLLDGEEDLDGDGLKTRWELLFGYDPRQRDSDNNGANDSVEDPDTDGLNNLAEQLAGSNPRNGDSDGDGWDDNGEVIEGTSPTSATSEPLVLASSAAVSFLNAVAETPPSGTALLVSSLAVSYLNALPETVPTGTLLAVGSVAVSYLNALPESAPAGTVLTVGSLPVSYLNALAEPPPSGTPFWLSSPPVSYLNAVGETPPPGTQLDLASPVVSYHNQ